MTKTPPLISYHALALAHWRAVLSLLAAHALTAAAIAPRQRPLLQSSNSYHLWCLSLPTIGSCCSREECPVAAPRSSLFLRLRCAAFSSLFLRFSTAQSLKLGFIMIRPDIVVVMAGVDMFALLNHFYFELDLILKKKICQSVRSKKLEGFSFPMIISTSEKRNSNSRTAYIPIATHQHITSMLCPNMVWV